MKKTNKIITTTAALTVLATAIAPLGNAFAASTPTWSEGSGTTTIVRQIQNAYGTINNTFGYTISPATDNPSGATGAPTSASIVFNDTYSSQATAAKTAVVDFRSMQFDQAGDYSFIITETSSSNTSLYPVDSSNTYTAVIQVRNNADLTGYIAGTYVKDINGDKLGTITGASSEVIFASTPAYTNIRINETVSGNAADPNKCFEYRLTFSTSDSYVLSTESTCSNPDSVGNGDTIKLKHNDTAVIGLVRAGSQIPVGTEYSINKVDTSDGYTTSMDGTTRTAISKTMVATGASNYNTANVTAINEHRDSSVDTNAFMNIAIYVLLAIAGAIGLGYIIRRKSQKQA